MDKHKYPVLPGCKFGTKVEYTAGELVELTEEEATPHIGIVLGPAITEGKPPPATVTPAASTKPDQPPTPASAPTKGKGGDHA